MNNRRSTAAASRSCQQPGCFAVLLCPMRVRQAGCACTFPGVATAPLTDQGCRQVPRAASIPAPTCLWYSSSLKGKALSEGGRAEHATRLCCFERRVDPEDAPKALLAPVLHNDDVHRLLEEATGEGPGR